MVLKLETPPWLNWLRIVQQRQSKNSHKVIEGLVNAGHIPRIDNDELQSIVNAPGSQQQFELLDLLMKHNADKPDLPLREIFRDVGFNF